MSTHRVVTEKAPSLGRYASPLAGASQLHLTEHVGICFRAFRRLCSDVLRGHEGCRAQGDVLPAHFDALANILFDHLLPAEGGLPEDAAAYVRRGNALPVRRPEAAAGRVLVAVVNGLDYARHLVHMLIGGMPVAEFATASDFL